MCGIVGCAGGAHRDVAAALAELRHRGPDGVGEVAGGGATIGMRRLAIIDLETGDQPLANEDGSVTVVCNGELYNYVELRRELEADGHVFTSGSDVAVVPHLYEELGERCFARLRGMFAIALWDERRRRLVLARDRFGIKPLYVAEHRGALLFASEIPALLALGVPARPDVGALADYLSLGYVPGEATGLLGIRSLEPGHFLVWEDGRVREGRFSSFEPRESADLEATLTEAVSIHLRSDVPLAVLLSGGLDSSLIAVLAAQELGSLSTFTVGFDDAAFDELEPARAVAAAIGADHHEVAVRADVVGDLPAIVRHLGEPNGDSSAIPLWYVCRAVAEHVKVALAGEGGDEVFGGYSRYAWDGKAKRIGQLLPAAALASLLETVPGVRGRAVKRDRKDLARRAVKLLRHAGLPDAERYYSWFALASEDAKAELLVASHEPTARVFAALLGDAPAGLTELGRLQAVDLRSMLEKDLLVKADRISMAHSLELRVPLLDNEVVAAGLALPDGEKVRGIETKRAIRRLVERRLGPEIARRPKQGFEVPIDRWLRRDLAPLAEDLLSRERVAARGVLRPEAVERRLRDHLAGRADHGLSLYGLMTLELWFEQVVDAAPSRTMAA